MKFFAIPNTADLLEITRNEMHTVRNAKHHGVLGVVQVFVPPGFDEEAFMTLNGLHVVEKQNGATVVREPDSDSCFAFLWLNAVAVPEPFAKQRAATKGRRNILKIIDGKCHFLDCPDLDENLTEGSVGYCAFSEASFDFYKRGRDRNTASLAISMLEAALMTQPEAVVNTLLHGNLPALNRLVGMEGNKEYQANMNLEGKLVLQDANGETLDVISSPLIERALKDHGFEELRADLDDDLTVMAALRDSKDEEDLTPAQKEKLALASEYVRLCLHKDNSNAARMAVSAMAGNEFAPEHFESRHQELVDICDNLSAKHNELTRKMGKHLTQLIDDHFK